MLPPFALLLLASPSCLHCDSCLRGSAHTLQGPTHRSRTHPYAGLRWVAAMVRAGSCAAVRVNLGSLPTEPNLKWLLSPWFLKSPLLFPPAVRINGARLIWLCEKCDRRSAAPFANPAKQSETLLELPSLLGCPATMASWEVERASRIAMHLRDEPVEGMPAEAGPAETGLRACSMN
jgi:hypothetical protein